MFVVVDIAVLAIRFVIGNHFRRAGGQGGFSLMICRPECCDLSTRSFPSRPVRPVLSRPVPSCPVRAVPSACSGRRPGFEPLRQLASVGVYGQSDTSLIPV